MVDLFIARDGTVCKNMEEVEKHNKKMREKESKSGVVYIDYRFIVKAKTITEGAEKVSEFLPKAIDGLWYTEVRSSHVHPRDD